MSSLNALLNTETDNELKETLLERLDIVAHKIKFMDKVPVCMLDSLGQPNLKLADLILTSGAALTDEPMDAAFVIFYEEAKQLDDLMRSAPVHLNVEWSAVKFNRVCLLADDYLLNNTEDVVSLVEDVAEMIHPGQFIFGHEGDKWIRFGA